MSNKPPPPIPDFQPADRRRLELLIKSILPPSYYFASGYRRMVHDLDLFRQKHPGENYPDGETFLQRVSANDGYELNFQISDTNSLCNRAHAFAKSEQAKAAQSASAARLERNGATGRYQPAQLESAPD